MSAAAAAGLALNPRLLHAQAAGVVTKPIPSTREQIPIIGLGSSATFSQTAGREDIAALSEVLKALLDNGCTVFDTAPSYGASEQVAGQIVKEQGAQEKIFWATKLNVAGFGGGTADPERARAQLAASFERAGHTPIDLIQVHNLADMPTQYGLLKELKSAGRVRYIGATSTSKRQYEQFETILRNETLDFIGIDYAVDNTSAEERLFPIAQERGIAVMVYVPFGRTRLFNRVQGREVPAWAAEFGATTWAQFFLKFAAGHPAVTVVTPATSQARHMVDNAGAARGRLPDAAERRRMVELIASLPAAAA